MQHINTEGWAGLEVPGSWDPFHPYLTVSFDISRGDCVHRSLYEEYGEKGLVVLGFPCNQFGKQEPLADTEIGAFCSKNYGVEFPMHEKIDVNGGKQHPLYEILTREAPGAFGTQRIKWNFTKFLVDGEGRVTERFAPMTTPDKLRGAIEELLDD